MKNDGIIKLQQGDCLELMKAIPDKSIDLILCDLPYGMTQCKWDSVIPLPKLWEQYKRIIKNNGAIILFSAEPFTSMLITSNLDMFRYDIIWQKEQGTDFLNANRKPLRVHENICVFYRRMPTFNKQCGKGKPYKAVHGNKGTSCWGEFKQGMCPDSDGSRYPLTVLKFKRERGLHPTQKPVPLLEYLIRTYTNEDETVLDNCMGSGSTGVACVNLKRNFIGMELEEKYFKIAEERINNARLNQQTAGNPTPSERDRSNDPGDPVRTVR